MYFMRYSMLLCVVLMGITLSIFWQTGDHQFINFDDPLYVTNNPHVKGGITGKNILWAFTTTTASNWHPLTWLSHMADVEIFGLNPRGHHLTSVFIHTASTLLLFLLLTQITAAPWQSLFVAALFALHPLHVESVAWVAERKDVLSGFFWFLTLLFYAGYVKHRTVKSYFLTLFSFVLGLLTKPMLVTLPVTMLLLDYWPFHRFLRDQAEPRGVASFSFLSLVKEKIPFFLLSALASLITLYAQDKGGAMKSLEAIPFALRVENAMIAHAKYLGKTIWSSDLAIVYPFPPSLPLWQVLGSSLLLLLISMVVVRYRRRFPYLLVGWFWFLVTLVPVIGLIQVGGQSMADRYTYIPLTGLFMICSWGISDLLRSWRYRGAVLAILAGLVICASTVVTWQQLSYWKENISLYQHTLQVTTDNYLILNNYGIALADQGRFDEAILQYQEALRIWPKSATAHVNLGAALSNQGKFTEAISHYHEALRLIPDYALAHANLGRALASVGQVAEAMLHYERALQIDPSLSDIRLNLALLLLKSGRRDAAWTHYETVLRIDPYSTKAPVNMGAALAQEGRMEEAIRCFTRALQIDPDSIEAHFNLGVILARLNRGNEAMQHFSHVLRVKPDVEAARRWLEVLKQEK
jgi:tetratricopeptide (TPR) repeat protein